jgi:uncharacterized MAPEG superfamily protein
MTMDLKYLAWTAILTAALWIPYIACQVMTNGALTAENYRDPTPRSVPLWGARANRAHLNAVEVFAPFAALVVIGHLVGKADAIGIWAMAFFWVRVIHAVIFWVGIPLLRTIVFTLGFIVECVIFWIVIT